MNREKKPKNPVLYLYKGICKVHTFKNVVPKMYIFLWHFLTLNNAFEFNRLFITPTNNDINDIMIQKTVIVPLKSKRISFFVRMANSYLVLFEFLVHFLNMNSNRYFSSFSDSNFEL